MIEYLRRFATSPSMGLFDSKVPDVVRRSLQRVQLLGDMERRRQLHGLHSLLDGAHTQLVYDAAKSLYGERADEWAKGNYAGYRYLPLVRTLCDRLAVAFHRPPELYLHTGDNVPITEGPQAEQLVRDIEDGGLDTTLTQVERWVTCMRQCLVWPSYMRHNDTIRWRLTAPYDVWCLPNRHDTTDIQVAESVSILLGSREIDQLEGRLETFIHFTRTQDVNPEWRMYVTENGKITGNGLFEDTDINEYGSYPFVMWQVDTPVQGEMWLPPKIEWLNTHIGLSLSLTDLFHASRYQAQGMLVARGIDTELQHISYGPGKVLSLPDPDQQIDWLSPPVETLRALEHYIDTQLRISAVSESLDSETWNSGSAVRNLAAMKQKQAALKLRRTRVEPHYKRHLRETWKRHKIVNDHAVRSGWSATRVEYGDLMLGVKFAKVAEIEDRFQGTQASIAEINAGLTTPADVVMKRDGISRAEAERLTESAAPADRGLSTYGVAKRPMPQPLAASPDDGTPRPPDVRE